MRIVSASDSALLISFADEISFEANQQVISLFRELERLHDDRIRNLHPAYSSLLIDFEPLHTTHKELENIVRQLTSNSMVQRAQPANSVQIPVCYDHEFAPDLARVAQHVSMTEEQIIALHSKSDYIVCFLGFSPGFAYLSGLVPQLNVPRLSTPRTHVPAGSVGLAGEQTGIYPNDSPGGWLIIGRTPLRMFDPQANPPSRLQPGDRVRFHRVSSGEFRRIAQQQ